MNKFTTSIIAIFAAATLSACATSGSAPNKFAANKADSPAQSFCKGQAVMVANRVAMQQNQTSHLAGRADPIEVREKVMADCLSQQRVADR